MLAHARGEQVESTFYVTTQNVSQVASDLAEQVIRYGLPFFDRFSSIKAVLELLWNPEDWTMWGMLYSPEVKVPIIAYASGNADVYERLIKLWDEWLSTTPDREFEYKQFKNSVAAIQKLKANQS
jgi:hypothetical protein